LIATCQRSEFVSDYPSIMLKSSTLILADCFDWMAKIPEQSIHSIVTDPPYGVKEYDLDQLTAKKEG